RGRRLRARQRDRAHLVPQAVVGLVLDRFARALLLHAGLEAAALDHEADDDAVEDHVDVLAGPYVGDEVLDRERRLLGVQFQRDDAVVGVQFDVHGFSWGQGEAGRSSARSMTTVSAGRCWCMPARRTGLLPIARTTSMPSMTRPNT